MSKRAERKYFALTPRMACEDLRSEPLALALLVHYEQVCGQNGGVCRWSLRETEEHTGISKSKVGELRDLLEELGYIQVLRDETNPRAPALVMLVDRWAENSERYQGQAVGGVVVREARNGRAGKGDGVRTTDTLPKSGQIVGGSVRVADSGVHQADTCPPHGQKCPPGGHAPIYKELKKQEQEQTQEPAAVVVPGESAHARAKAALVAAAAANGEKSSEVGKISQKGGKSERAERSGRGRPAQTGTGSGGPQRLGDVLDALAREAAGMDGVDASRALAAYAENIAPLTPIMAQKVRDAVSEYGQDEVLVAIEEAVTHNVRKWRYVEAILRRKAGQPKASEVSLRAKAIAWAREQGEDVPDGADGRELWTALVAAVGFDPRLVPQEFRALSVNAAAGR